MSWLSRLRLLSLLPASLVAVAAADAEAQTTAETLPGGGVVEWVATKTLLVQTDDDDELETPDDTEKDRFFNFAHCACSESDDSFKAGVFGFQVKVTGTVNTQTTGQIWVANDGVDCRNSDLRDGTPTECQDTGKTLPLDDLEMPETVTLPTHQIANLGTTTCTADIQTTRKVWVLASGEGGSGGNLNYGANYPYTIDTKPPSVPSRTTVKASVVEGTATISWTRPSSDEPVYYQALCATSAGVPLGKDIEARFDTTKSLCEMGSDRPFELDSASVGGDGTTVTQDTLPAGFLTDPKFICGEEVKGGSITIEGLKEDTFYYIAVVGVDLAGNADGFFLDKTVRSIPVTDIWEDLNEDGEYGVEGGFCLINETYGGGSGPANGLRAFRDETLSATALGRWLTAAYYQHVAPLGAHVHGSPMLRVIAAVVLLPAVAFALAWHLLTLPGLLALLGVAWVWRRRRSQRRQHRTVPRLVVASAAAAALVAVPALASAQSSIMPYWEEESLADETEETGPRWNVGIKVGPYTPGIDAQYQDQTGSTREPFKDAFRGGMWLPVLEVDFFILDRFGQLGIGGSAGFTGDGANPWVEGSDPNDPKRPRENAPDMKFRMVPLTLTAVYRATQLDDVYGIPVVPYIRGGLAYYIWWMQTPGGEVARVDDCAVAMEDRRACKASGGSLGLVGSVGLALRAESIDKNAALSMRESGIQHAGFYIEGSLGWVDGFGSDKRLALGDLTWFGGFNFEF
jgi:hypothetical protein